MLEAGLDELWRTGGPWLLLGGVCAALWVGWQTGRAGLRRRARRRVGRHRRVGERGEQAARRLLERDGWTIEDAQVRVPVVVDVDAERVTFEVRADFLVRRGRQRWIAEAKGATEAARLGTAATRRQVLEYAVAFDVEGVLLVDVPAGRVREVSFPQLRALRGHAAA